MIAAWSILARAEKQGTSLADLVALGKRVNGVTRSIGMALTSYTPPAKGSPLFEVGTTGQEPRHMALLAFAT